MPPYREHLHARLPTGADGSIPLIARAWAARRHGLASLHFLPCIAKHTGPVPSLLRAESPYHYPDIAAPSHRPHTIRGVSSFWVP